MKASPFFAVTACTTLLTPTFAFTTPRSLPPQLQQTPMAQYQSTTALPMFSGGALDLPEEEDDEKRTQIEQMAKAMGMSVEEYQLGITARERMEQAISDLRVVGGEESNGVTVERDGNMPPRHLVVNVTDEGKKKGKEVLEKLIVEALKSAGEKSKVGRDEAQKDMMKYIQESYKKLGMK